MVPMIRQVWHMSFEKGCTHVFSLYEKLQPSFHYRRSLLASFLSMKLKHGFHDHRSLAHVFLLCEKLVLLEGEGRVVPCNRRAIPCNVRRGGEGHPV